MVETTIEKVNCDNCGTLIKKYRNDMVKNDYCDRTEFRIYKNTRPDELRPQQSADLHLDLCEKCRGKFVAVINGFKKTIEGDTDD